MLVIASLKAEYTTFARLRVQIVVQGVSAKQPGLFRKLNYGLEFGFSIF